MGIEIANCSWCYFHQVWFDEQYVSNYLADKSSISPQYALSKLLRHYSMVKPMVHEPWDTMLCGKVLTGKLCIFNLAGLSVLPPHIISKYIQDKWFSNQYNPQIRIEVKCLLMLQDIILQKSVTNGMVMEKRRYIVIWNPMSSRRMKIFDQLDSRVGDTVCVIS